MKNSSVVGTDPLGPVAGLGLETSRIEMDLEPNPTLEYLDYLTY
jgi:hypothetical protein